MTIRWGKKCFIYFISVFAVSFYTCFYSKYEIFFFILLFSPAGFFSWPGATNANFFFMNYYLFFVILRALLHPPVWERGRVRNWEAFISKYLCSSHTKFWQMSRGEKTFIKTARNLKTITEREGERVRHKLRLPSAVWAAMGN